MRAFAAIVLVLWIAAPAAAQDCTSWSRLAGPQREATVTQMIQARVQSENAKKYQVSKGAIERCMRAKTGAIAHDFDDACAQQTRPMNPLDAVLTKHVYDCVNR